MGAGVYDQVKQNTPDEEAAFLAEPIIARLGADNGPHTRLLDIAVGTGRLPQALFAAPAFQGTIVGVDFSRKMLGQASHNTADYRDRITLINHPSVPLPFADATFQIVTSIEALEYMPDQLAAIREMVRVLRPNGWLAITNRIGPSAKMMPGIVVSLDRFRANLAKLGLVDISAGPIKSYWGIEFYILVFARKPTEMIGPANHV
jgi:ubiquinone/menaquinone biosynthesis C-methylase UbiE